MSMRGRRFVEFWREHGTRATARLIRGKLGDAVAGRGVFNPLEAVPSVAERSETVPQIYGQRFLSQQPLQTYVIPQPSLPRVSLVTDSIGSDSLFGGVGTALLFSAQLAKRMNATLRVVTRTEAPNPSNAWQILNAYGIELPHEIQFAFAPLIEESPGVSRTDAVASPGLDIYPDETFVTTSWWSTAAALPSVPHDSIIYLLQEDERMFYPFGEERVHCEQILRTEDIRFVINTQLLYDHLVASGLSHLSRTGCWFEPAFPKSLFHTRDREPGGKKRLFFYARPNNPRNLFHVGLTLLDRAVNEGILDLEQWDVFLVGKDIPNVSFADGSMPQRCEGLGWKAYADLVGTIDLGLSLMYTPHPSYPPFDLAASGAVVVTNRFANKQDLSRYSPNILCAELDMQALLVALREGIALAGDAQARSRNYAANGLGTDWALAFEDVLQSLTAAR